MGYTTDIWANARYRVHAAAFEALRRMTETGDGPLIHPVIAGDDAGGDGESVPEGAQIVAIALRPEWSEGYINTQARLLAEKLGGGRLVALLGVPRRRLAPDVQALARWIIY